MPNKLEGREIFAVGKWNGIEFSEGDLDDIAENFDKLADKHKVPLKFGHNDEQPITDGQPSIGWVSKVYRQGKKLLADFSDVPNVVVEAIKKRLYRTVSVELLFNVDNSGSKYNHVLDAVAILGADQPAVNTLADLDTLLATRTEFTGGHRIAFSTVKGEKKSDNDNQEFEMDEEEVKKLIAASLKPLNDEIDSLKDENKDLKKERDQLKASAEESEKKAREEKIAASRRAVTEILDEAVKDKSMTPAVREAYSKQIGVDDDERVVEIDLEQVKLMCGATKGEDDKQQGRFSRDDDNNEDESAEEALFRLTREHQAKHNVKDFSAAFTRVAEANPKLHKEYLDSNGEG